MEKIKSHSVLLKEDKKYKTKYLKYEKEFVKKYGIKPTDGVTWENIIKLVEEMIKNAR